MKYVKTIGSLMLVFLAVMSGAFALTQDKATTMCKDSFNAGNSCIVEEQTSPNAAVGRDGTKGWTYYPILNANDFDNHLNKYMSTRDVQIKLGNKKNFMAVVGKETLKSKNGLFNEVYGDNYVKSAKLFNAPQIAFAVTNYFNIIDVKWLPSHTSHEYYSVDGVEYAGGDIGCADGCVGPSISGTVYKEPSLN